MAQDDHDQRLKTLLKLFFAEFMELFFSVWAKRLDCRHPEWLEQDAFVDPPTGPRRAMDLIAKVPILESPPDLDPEATEMLAIIHIEIESQDHLGNIPQKMYHYDYVLEQQYKMPILPIVFFLDLGYDGLGELSYTQRVYDFEKLKFSFLYVGLKGLDGLQYAQGDNLLGASFAPLMRVPKDQLAQTALASLLRFAEAPLPQQQRMLLAECVQAYTPFTEEQQRLFEQLCQAQPEGALKTMNQTTYDKGTNNGMTLKSRQLLRLALAKRFGPLPANIDAIISTLGADRADELILTLDDYQSLADINLDNLDANP